MELSPTLFQNFSPARSPFYGMAAAAVFGIIAIAGQNLASDGLSVMIAILGLSVAGSLIIGTELTEFQLNYAIVHARTVGVVGGIIALATLIGSHSTITSQMYYICWYACFAHILSMLFLFAVKAKNKDQILSKKTRLPVKRFNIVQYSLMNTILISALSHLSSKLNVSEYGLYYANYIEESLKKSLFEGLIYTVLSPLGVFFQAISGYNEVIGCILFLIAANMTVGLVRIFSEVQPGAKSKLEEINYTT